MGKVLTSMLPKTLKRPGFSNRENTFWVFPVLAETQETKQEIFTLLRHHGFDVSNQHSLCLVSNPQEKNHFSLNHSKAILDQIIYLPFYPEIPISEIKRMANLLTSCSVELKS